MDFHSLKRKKLQSLCKKHGIPANKTNLQMADLLTAALAPKEKGNSILVEDINERNSEDEQKNCKKVRFSPDVETREYEPSGYKKEAKRTSRTSTLTTSSLKESIDNRRGRGNGKTGSVSRTRRPHAKADKEVSSVMESDGVANMDGGEARMVGRRSTRTVAKFRDSDLINKNFVDVADHETTRFSFNGEENDVPEEKQADANDVPEEKQADANDVPEEKQGDALPQFFMDELEDGKVSYIAVAKNTSDEICEKDVVDGMGKICAREVGDSDVGKPLLSEAMDAPSFLELRSYQLNSYEDTHLKIHVESTFFTNREDKDPSDGNLTSNNLEEAMHVEENHREESELALEDNLKSEGLGCTELSEDNAACIERLKQDMQLDNSSLSGIDKPTYIGAPGDISPINQEFVDLQIGKDNIAAYSFDQSIAIYGPDILKEQANISYCGDLGISENEVCEKHKDSRVATGKINVLQEAATYKAFDGQLEDEIIRTDDGRVQESDEVANNPIDNPSLRDDARDHDEVANEQYNAHSDTPSEEVFTYNSFLNELSCENETEIQPTEAGREQCLPELGDRETAANSEQMLDTKELDAVVSLFKGKTAEAVVYSSCHESEAFDLNSIFEEGEYVAEKQVRMVDGSVPENKTEIQPTEAGREQCLPELCDRVLNDANCEQMVDTKKLDAAVSPFEGKTAEAVVDSSCHETEAFELNLFFEEGEHVVEKQGADAFPVNLVSMDGGSFPENVSSTLIDEEAEQGYTANSIVEGMQKTEAVMVGQPHALAVSADQEVTAEQGKSCESKLQSSKQTSDLISCTPQKFAEPSAMKENAPSLKISLTASRMSRKRHPLKDLRN